MEHLFERAHSILSDATHVEVFTGAGMSADSGIATYRDAQTGHLGERGSGRDGVDKRMA